MPKNDAAKKTSGTRKLILCFDGTWNTPEDETNVSRIYAAIADKHSLCDRQLKFYDKGVGTTWGSRIAGGAFGWGLDENILEGYCWLIDNYGAAATGAKPVVDPSDNEEFENGDQIFLFGFSRGAFTARSLSGLINTCGLVRKERNVKRTRTDDPLVRDAWKLYRDKPKDADARTQPQCKTFREQHSHNVKIRFIGVWDTVGALGTPDFGGSVLPIRRRRYRFHDTGLCRIVENAYQAVAIDEHRKDYEVSLWSAEHPTGTKEVEQRWFPGAHSNVGGGYQDDLLPELSLRWISEHACRLGLKFAPCGVTQNDSPAANGQQGEQARCNRELREFQLDGTELMGPVRDSFKEFMFGVYRVGAIARSMGSSIWGSIRSWGRAPNDTQAEGTDIDGRYYRPMLMDGVNEVIDDSAQKKWARDPRYRPRNLADAGR